MDDLKDDMNSVLLVVKKEKILPLLPPKRTQFDLVVKPPASCKRKPSDAWDLENLGTYEALRRLLTTSPVLLRISKSSLLKPSTF